MNASPGGNALRIAVTLGEPAGVGPELCARLAASAPHAELVFLGDADLLAARARLVAVPLEIEPYEPERAVVPAPPGVARCLHIPLAVSAQPGRLDVRNAPYVLATLERAASGCLAGEFAALVTAPVHKGVINDAGVPFRGHTEFLAARSGIATTVMMLVAGTLRVALATTHLPLRAVSEAITRDGLTRTLETLHAGLQRWFGIAQPRIGVCGLNPHAGEGGHLGREELDVIAPVLAALRARGYDLAGPLAADTAFTPARLATLDAVLAMYHDQGLPVLKYAGFGRAVNVTLGLPFVRTSVDHGTALELAGTGRADAGSLNAALALALELAARARAQR
ncbi:MAG TPA: 4-hydroxythreonine-4-phosphate dehydrogenase PdxA [Gammaproteobacteria bacterium]|nr:4-hydroxythreonine-4-phosphate dehydrogenase PdxA [Gammaproteobacteria bacterium]